MTLEGWDFFAGDDGFEESGDFQFDIDAQVDAMPR